MDRAHPFFYTLCLVPRVLIIWNHNGSPHTQHTHTAATTFYKYLYIHTLPNNCIVIIVYDSIRRNLLNVGLEIMQDVTFIPYINHVSWIPFNSFMYYNMRWWNFIWFHFFFFATLFVLLYHYWANRFSRFPSCIKRLHTFFPSPFIIGIFLFLF